MECINRIGVFFEKNKVVAEQKNPVDIATAPYPGFSTDCQPLFCSLLSQAKGKSTVTEKIYTDRFRYCPELVKLGADINVLENGFLAMQKEKCLKAVINGPKPLKGAEVTATDIRGGAGLVLAALAAKGKTVIHNAEEINRGYEALQEKLSRLGAAVELH